MNELQPNAKIISDLKTISKFKGEINSYIVSNKNIYYDIIDILNAISKKDITFTKSNEFISDLIEALTELNQNHDSERYSYLETNILEIIDNATTLKELTTDLNDFVKSELCIQFYDLCDHLVESYYTS